MADSTDREMLVAMFDRAGVVYQMNEERPDVITVSADEGPPYGRDEGPNQGYAGFASSFHFSSEGALLAVGAWE